MPDRGFASIGYGLPGAIGAKLGARRSEPWLLITGDGGFNMTLGELETARRLGLDIVLVVVNNAASGYVKALQHLMYGERRLPVVGSLAETDYARNGRRPWLPRHSCRGPRTTFPAAFARAFEASGPVVIDVIVTRDPAN